MKRLFILALLLSSNLHAAGAEIKVKIKLPDNWECLVGRLPADQCDEDDDGQGEDEMNIVDPEPQTYYDGDTQYTL